MRFSPNVQKVLLFGLALIGFLAAWLWTQNHTKQARDATAPLKPREIAVPIKLAKKSKVDASLPELRDTRSAEAIWRILSDADQAYLDRALAAGLQLKGRIGPLGLVKVAGPLDVLRAWSKPSMEAGLNVPVSLPRFPNQPALDGVSPFKDQLLDYFGLKDRSADWGKGVRIAILDTGISAHSALANANLNSINEATDDNGHGTAVASLIAGNDAYAKGLAPGAELLVYKVLDANGRGDAFGIADAIVSATDRGAQLISLSAGSTSDSSVLREAVDYATARGVVIVAAAGNEDATELLYPAAYENVIAVGAVDANGATATFSNSGKNLDLAAPGVGIYSAYSENQYIEFSGTSAAAPIVTGAIAALASEDPFLSVGQASELLLAYSDDAGAPGRDPHTGQGIIDPLRVIERNEPNFSDLGVSAPYLLPETLEDDTVEVSINVQNRGNQYIANASVVIEINGTASTHRVAGLDANASKQIIVRISADTLRNEKGVVFEVEVTAGPGQTDEREQNDGYSAILKLEPTP